MKISKKANEKAEYLRQMLEAMTGQKVRFEEVKGAFKKAKPKKKKIKRCYVCNKIIPSRKQLCEKHRIEKVKERRRNSYDKSYNTKDKK